MGFVALFWLVSAGKSVLEMVVSSRGVNTLTYLMCGLTSGRMLGRVRTLGVMWTLGVRGQFASADGVHHAKPLIRHRLCHRLRH